MALISDKKSFIKGLGILVDVDMGMLNLVFPQSQTMKTELIEYDTAMVEGVSPTYNSFANTAHVVKKDGKDVVTIAPINFNDSISKETIDADMAKFGQNEYGDGTIDTQMESLLNGIGKLKLNAMVGTKRVAYEVLVDSKIKDGYEGKNGVEDIVFPRPLANIEVLPGASMWNSGAPEPAPKTMARAVSNMKVKPRFAIMNETTYAYFINNGIRTADNSSTGTKKNYIANEQVDPNSDFVRMGRVIDGSLIIDVYVERGTRKLSAGGYVPYMPDWKIAYAGGVSGKIIYGGIPVAKKGVGVTRISAKEDVQEIITENPPQHILTYRTAPTPVIPNGEGFYTQTVGA